MTAKTLDLPEPLNPIGGEWTAAGSGKTLDVVCPSDGKVFASMAAGDGQDIDAAVVAARHAFEDGDWGKLTAAQRGRLQIGTWPRKGAGRPARILDHQDNRPQPRLR